MTKELNTSEIDNLTIAELAVENYPGQYPTFRRPVLFFEPTDGGWDVRCDTRSDLDGIPSDWYSGKTKYVWLPWVVDGSKIAEHIRENETAIIDAMSSESFDYPTFERLFEGLACWDLEDLPDSEIDRILETEESH